MTRCSYCGRETELHQADVPTCTECAHLRALTRRNVHSVLVQELLQATAELDSLTEAYDEVMLDIQAGLPASDGIQRIRLISEQVAAAREKLSRTHSRLSDFLNRGTVPEDLK